MKINLCTIDWVAISALVTSLMVVFTWWALRNNKKQLHELQKQNFDNLFFHLLAVVKGTILAAIYVDNEHKYSGNEAFEKSYSSLINFIGRRVVKEGYIDDVTGYPVETEFENDISIENAESSYREFYDKFPDIGLYFRILYRLVKLINGSSLTDSEKYTYTSIVRAQMSDYELLWLFYNCTVGYGKEKFKPLVEKWVLLQNMREDKLADESHYEWLNISAFEKGNRYE